MKQPLSRPMRKLASLMVPLQEDTTSANIAFLPSGFKSARTELRKISKYKSQWHVTMLETVDENEFSFEERMKMKVRPDHREQFCKEVLNCSASGFPKLVSLRHVIEEARNESVETRKRELDNTIRESLGLREVQESARKFASVFGGRLTESRAPCAVDLYSREVGLTKLLETVHGTLLTRGKVEMLHHAMNGGGVAGFVPQSDNLSAASVVAECYGHKTVFTAAFGKDGVLRESVSLKGVPEEDLAVPYCRVVNESLVPPPNSTFTLPMLWNLKNALKEADESDERIDLIESMS